MAIPMGAKSVLRIFVGTTVSNEMSLIVGRKLEFHEHIVVNFDERAHLRFEDISALGSAFLKQIAQCKSWIVK